MRTDGDEAATVAATACEASERIEIVAERRRAHDDVFRAMVVADALRPGARVQEVARRHRICPSLVYRWRRLIKPGQAAAPSAGFIPVSIMPVRADLTSWSQRHPCPIVVVRFPHFGESIPSINNGIDAPNCLKR